MMKCPACVLGKCCRSIWKVCVVYYSFFLGEGLVCVNSMEVVMMASFSFGYRCSNETCCNSSNHCVCVCECVCVSVCVCEYVMSSKAVS